MEDKKAIKETLIINGGGRPKKPIFGLQTRAYGKKRRRKEKKRKKEKIKLRYGYMTSVWNCMDFGMIFIHKLLGYGLLGFSLETN